MSRITCKEAADRVIEQHGFEGLSAENFDTDTSTTAEYLGDKVENACFAFVHQLSDEEKFQVWYTCDDSLDWNEGISYYGTDSSKSEMLAGFAGWSIHLTIKAQAFGHSDAAV